MEQSNPKLEKELVESVVEDDLVCNTNMYLYYESFTVLYLMIHGLFTITMAMVEVLQ